MSALLSPQQTTAVLHRGDSLDMVIGMVRQEIASAYLRRVHGPASTDEAV